MPPANVSCVVAIARRYDRNAEQQRLDRQVAHAQLWVGTQADVK